MSNGASFSTLDAKLAARPNKAGFIVVVLVIAAGIGYVGLNLVSDLSGQKTTSILPFVLLALALLIALGFEFVNGFHDTANAVATVIYTNSLDPQVAVVWSGFWNFLGVMLSGGAVAFAIISLLPVELILQVGTGAGFAMVFSLLVAAIIWNLGTWYFGLPSSSSHTLIGSIIGVGLANQFMSTSTGTSGVDWAQAGSIGKSLFISPLVGSAFAALLLLLTRRIIPDQRLYSPPVGDQPPPLWIRILLLLTCTGVSFAHGSNDGQKGMGLIMLILIGTVPTAFALNHAVTADQTQEFVVASKAAAAVFYSHGAGSPSADPRIELTAYLRSRVAGPNTLVATGQLIGDLGEELSSYGLLTNLPAARTRNFRNDLYLVGEAIQLMQKSGQPGISPSEWSTLVNYKKHVDLATRFIPVWVKVSVAIALGLGTMIGWKRIVVTVGERIGKEHLTYAQGAAAEITAMTTIAAADSFGLPVSTTHVLSSAVAGTMAANRSGLQWGTVRNLLMAWVLTLPASIILSGTLYWIFRKFV
jgi:inorganic phosphate transporter, PiT family